MDSTIAEGVQWSKEYAISDPLPLWWGRIPVKHKEAAVSAFAAISLGIPNRAVAVKPVSVISCLSKSRRKIGIIVLCHFYSFNEDKSTCLALISSVHPRYAAFGQH